MTKQRLVTAEALPDPQDNNPPTSDDEEDFDHGTKQCVDCMSKRHRQIRDQLMCLNGCNFHVHNPEQYAANSECRNSPKRRSEERDRQRLPAGGMVLVTLRLPMVVAVWTMCHSVFPLWS